MKGEITMNINWKVRLRNKTWLLAMLAAIVAFVYQILGICEVVPAIGQDQITQLVAIIINILVALGIVVDPTTTGVTDSQQAMTYDKPKVSDQDGGL